MPRKKHDPCRSKAKQTIRNLMAEGWDTAALLIDAAAEAIGGDPEAKRIAKAVWEQDFTTYEAN